jgi:hydrogenase nickel incorporation protein HypB
MCGTCGCGEAGVRVTELGAPGHDHGPAHGGHGHAPGDAHPHEHAPGNAHPHEHAPGNGHGHVVALEEDILGANDALAAENRRVLTERGVLAVNLMSSPGSGKTTLLVRTLTDVGAELGMSVVEGDQETLLDAERIGATGARVVQVNTGAGCHLDATMLARAMAALAPARDSVMVVENVGNLVCPALFDLGEAARVVVMSVTEGADKPLKYPHMFRTADLVLLNKVDLLPYVDFDVETWTAAVERVRPGVEVLSVSATRGDGLDTWYAWLRAGIASRRGGTATSA